MISERLIEGIIQHSIDLAAEISPVFADRTNAGHKLADVLTRQRFHNPLLIAIPSGGVPVALPIGDRFCLPLHLAFAAKVRFASDRRFGIGAVSVSGDVILNQELLEDLPLKDEIVKSGIEQARQIMTERMEELAAFTPPIPNLRGRTVILVEDGIATGYTVLAAAKHIESFQPESIVITSPVTSNAAYRRLHDSGYEQVVLLKPDTQAFLVDNFYFQFPQISMAEVKQMLNHNRT